MVIQYRYIYTYNYLFADEMKKYQKLIIVINVNQKIGIILIFAD